MGKKKQTILRAASHQAQLPNCVPCSSISNDVLDVVFMHDLYACLLVGDLTSGAAVQVPLCSFLIHMFKDVFLFNHAVKHDVRACMLACRYLTSGAAVQVCPSFIHMFNDVLNSLVMHDVHACLQVPHIRSSCPSMFLFHPYSTII